jgi:ribonuclease VapC
MIAVDTSAMVAILLREAERDVLLARLREARSALISTVSVVEARMVVYGRRGAPGVVLLDDFLRLPGFEPVPVGHEEMEAASRAFVAYGKGTGHPASLNFGDIFSYALAKTRRLPLLFKGDDFSHTDIVSALHGDSDG